MLAEWSRNWWMVALRGVAALAFGILAFVWPGITLLVMVIMFGVYALVDGAMALFSAFRGEGGGSKWPLVLEGVAGLAAGLVTIFWPGITALALLFLIGAWAVITGVTEVVQAIRLREEIEGEWMLGAAGVLSVLFGIGVMLFPAAGAMAVAWIIGAYAIVFGVLMLALAFRLRGEQSSPEQVRQAA